MAAAIPEESKVTYEFLGRTGLKVSNIALGCLTFGRTILDFPDQCDEDTSHQIMNRFVEWGGNFLDTADVYGLGHSEEILGRWLERQNRDNFVIATKCRMDVGTEKNINNVGLSRRHITESVDRSLQRLHTDFVDLYQTHVFDAGTPLEETLRTLDDLVRVGKVRYLGVSNVSGWQLQKLVATTKKLGLNPIVTLQQQYSLLHRESEAEPFQVCKLEGMGVLPWMPLKAGILAGVFSRGVTPTEGRTGNLNSKWFNFMTDFGDRTSDIVDVVRDIAKQRGRTCAQVSIRWLLQKDIVPSVIIGVNNLTHLDDNMGAASGWSLTQEEMQRLDDVSASAPRYPYSMISSFNNDRKNPANGYYQVTSTF